jgi:outer membrane protein OmpA-like peptidoglycan-associated protein/uncharacterized protein YidB (DUF937 family)
MALFDSIISSASEKLDLGDKSGTLLAALLALMTNQETGGFAGFIDRFREAGLGDMVTSWITSGDNAEISDEQVESAFGEETITTISEEVGIEREKTKEALAFMTPKVVDSLSPDGEVPDEESLLSKIGGFLTGMGGATAGAVGDAAGATVDKGKEVVGDAAEAVGDVAGAAADKAGNAFESVGDVFDGGDNGGSILKWLLPLILLGVLIVLGFMFCSGNTGVKPADPNSNKAETEGGKATEGGKTTDVGTPAVSLEAKDGKYFLTGTVKDEATKNNILKEAEATFGVGNVDASGLKVDATVADLKAGWFDGFKSLLPDLKGWKTGTISWTGDKLSTAGEIPGAVTDKLKSLFGGWSFSSGGDGADSGDDGAKDADRELTEVTLSGETKLQAYPGGIEDQLIKFIQSDEYKNATDEELKNKWFDFDDLNFKFGSTELVAESKRQLDNIVAILKEYPDVKIKIGGYTDKKGNDANNKKLSDSRAKAVQAALEKAGVGAQVPEAEGYGEEFAKVDESASDEERASDRKTSIRLLK